MALKAGKNCYLLLGGTANLSPYITNCEIELKGKTLIDVTTMGQSNKVYASDEISDITFTVDFLFDDTTTTGSWPYLETMWDLTTVTSYQLRPNGDGTSPNISGNCYIETAPVAIAIGDMIRMNGVVFKHTGATDVTPA